MKLPIETARALNEFNRRWWGAVQYTNAGKPTPPRIAPTQDSPQETYLGTFCHNGYRAQRISNPQGDEK
jgi:hypothetical protein